MFTLPFDSFFSKDFLNQTYGQFIKAHILNHPELTDDELLHILQQSQPTLDPLKLQELLNTKIRCNAGITPCLLQDDGTLLFAGAHSQRKGDNARGVLVSATGLIEDQDVTLMDGALRELHEELGYPLYAACKDQMQLALAELHAGPGRTVAEVAANLNAFINKEKRSISFHANIIVPVYGSQEEQQQLLIDSNNYLQKVAKAYAAAVSICYEHPKDQPYSTEDYALIRNHAEELLNTVQPPLSTQIAALLQQLNQEENAAHLVALAHTLLEFSENDRIILITAPELKRMAAEARRNPKAKLIRGLDEEGQEHSFYQPALESMDSLLTTFKTTLKDTSRILTTTFMQFIKLMMQQFDAGNLFNINPSKNSLYRPNNYFTRQGESIQMKKINFLQDMLYANLMVNPRALGLEGIASIALGQIYEEFAKDPTSRMPKNIIPSHVNAAETWNPVHFMRIPVGSLLFKYLRPKGWLGEYATNEIHFKPSELGIADQISDPNDATKLMDRVHAQLVVIDELPSPVAVSKASAVMDFWSQTGRKVWCDGGGTQIFMPMNAKDKNRCLAILKPEPGDFNYHQMDKLIEIAQQNNVQFLTKQELLARGIDIKPLDTNFTPLDIPAEQQLQLAHQAYYLGDYHMAIKALRSYVELNGLTAYQKLSAQVVLGGLYVISGNYEEAQLHLTAFIQNAERISDKSPLHTYLQLLANIHLARAQVIPDLAINQLRECFAFIEKHKRNKEIAQHLSALKQVLHLEMGIAYNKSGRQFSNCQDYDDFDAQGDPVKTKKEDSLLALNYLHKADYTQAAPIEGLIFLLERASAKTRLRQTTEALEDLALAEKQLGYCYDIFNSALTHGAFKNLETELKLLSLSIRLGVGLNLSLAKKYKTPIPAQYQSIDPVLMIKELGLDLDKLTAMEVTTLFKRWIGPNANNLFIEGWYYTADDAKNQDKGGNLLALYRKYIPFDLSAILQKLEDNQIKELNLAFLGLPAPAGISDQDFAKLCTALAKNSSLEKLFLRKCSDKFTGAPGQESRLNQLFKALNQAQANGQQLSYLSYSGVRFTLASEYEDCLNYLENNKSLKVLDLSWYDWKDKACLKRLGACIGAHPNLRTVLNGINNHPEAGEIFYQECHRSEHLAHVMTFDGTMDPQTQQNAITNREWLMKLQDELKSNQRSKMVSFSRM
ncbi:hypothetical protein [Legionella shakespearei]|uniref:Nudix hydrolase domain-containing protein n=1 Tax=Legionella shakespearei DSM 23087 TaxID=1122169 RepID=A0A0W0Z8K1_9GAMM|nr:hypothetical protein [Legionella shakespearei]KTD65444.1 hypothetical protein Lsha_0261 [Legionella shakespearei DSM 23087]